MVQGPTEKHLLALLFLVLFLSSAFVPTVFAWGNGGYSADLSNPDYGTHDWIAQHAKNWLPAVERKWIDDNLNYFLYGTEYPDNSGASYGTTSGYGDTAEHHNYYDSSGSVTDASAAIRAKAEYDKALADLKAGRNVTAAIYAGSMSHYIDDVAVFGHVMTGETHHSDYEDYVGTRTASYSYGVFESYLVFDGKLENVSAYDASINLGRNTFNDGGGAYTANWMDTHYDWSSLAFKNRCGESLNLATNYVADVLHTLAVAAFGTTTTTTKSSSSISCSVSSSSLTVGDSITVSGSISPVRSGVTVTISYKSDGSFSNLSTVSSASDGSYSYSWKPASGGPYQLKASWAGDSTYSGATSDAVSVTVNKISSTVSCKSSSSEITDGDTITISGSISPAGSGMTVTLTYTKPDGTTVARTVTTGSDGSYSDSYKPDTTGSWSVKASWDGDAERTSATSQSTSFNVKKKGCIIATATYGSELSPEVQFLRDFRDNTVLSTFAGSSFMTVFNGFYYSFSPSVASTISDNEALRGVMKVVLYPLIGMLHLSSAFFSLFSFSPELGVVMAGLVASALMAVVYVLPWFLLFGFLKKLRLSTKIIRIVGLIWAGSVMTMTVAEVATSSPLMMASTGAFILTTMCLTTLFSIRVVTKFHAC